VNKNKLNTHALILYRSSEIKNNVNDWEEKWKGETKAGVVESM
jgi:hypothetical protein